MLQLKSELPSCRIVGVRPEIVLAILICERVYEQYKIVCVVTAVTDSKHSESSLHYVGFAFDVRKPGETYVNSIFEDLKKALGVDFDVVKEDTHFHIEFQPKKGLNL